MLSHLTTRDCEILAHVGRYRLTTPEALRRTLFPNVGKHAVTHVTTRLVRNGWLHRHKLLARQCYFTLTARAALLLGESVAAISSPLPAEQLMRDFGMLAYCRLSDAHRDRYRRCASAGIAAHLECPGLDSDRYFLDRGFCPVKCGILWVEAGDEEPAVLAARCWDDFAARNAHLAFRGYVNENGFRVAVLVSTRERAAGVERALADRPWPEGVYVGVEVLPKLLDFSCLPERKPRAAEDELGAPRWASEGRLGQALSYATVETLEESPVG